MDRNQMAERLKEIYSEALFNRVLPSAIFFETEPKKITWWQGLRKRINCFLYRLKRAWIIVLDREVE